MRPTSITTSQTTSSITNTLNSNATMGTNVENPATRRRVEMMMDEGQGRQSNDEGPTGTNLRPNVTTSAMNRRVEQASCTHCRCHHQLSGGAMDTNVPLAENQRLNLHTEYEGGNDGASRFFRRKKHTDGSGSRECQIIRILPDENDDYMDIVRDSVSAQTRRGPKPMFVNNYFVGNNNWRTVPKDNARLDTTHRTSREVDRPRGYRQLFLSWEKESRAPVRYKQASRE